MRAGGQTRQVVPWKVARGAVGWVPLHLIPTPLADRRIWHEQGRAEDSAVPHGGARLRGWTGARTAGADRDDAACNYRTALETHLRETRDHAKRVKNRLSSLGGGDSVVQTAV